MKKHITACTNLGYRDFPGGICMAESDRGISLAVSGIECTPSLGIRVTVLNHIFLAKY